MKSYQTKNRTRFLEKTLNQDQKASYKRNPIKLN